MSHASRADSGARGANPVASGHPAAGAGAAAGHPGTGHLAAGGESGAGAVAGAGHPGAGHPGTGSTTGHPDAGHAAPPAAASGHPGRFELAHHFDTPRHQYESDKLAMWLFLVTEILLFGGLFCAYAVYRANHPEVFLFAHTFLDKQLGAVNTIVLLFSSFTMAWAVRAAQLGQRRLLVGLLAVTLLCGFGFLGIKGIEYEHKWKHGLLWGENFDYAALQPGEAGHGERLPAEAAPAGDAAGATVAAGETGSAADAAGGAAGEAGDAAGETGEQIALADGSAGQRTTDATSPGGTAETGSGRAGEGAETAGSTGAADRTGAAEDAGAAGGTGSEPGPAQIDAHRESPLPRALSPGLRAPSVRSKLAQSAPAPAGIQAVVEQHAALGAAAEIPRNVHVFFGIYFVMTGLHGLHVIAGMGLIGWLLVRALRGDFGTRNFTAVDLGGLYWHLVDLIWIFLFPLLYLIH
ncbi:MAG: cytochrome c oxidase subunit 3 [Candidatus Krumholzibacteriia bacterium]